MIGLAMQPNTLKLAYMHLLSQNFFVVIPLDPTRDNRRRKRREGWGLIITSNLRPASTLIRPCCCRWIDEIQRAVTTLHLWIIMLSDVVTEVGAGKALTTTTTNTDHNSYRESFKQRLCDDNRC